MAAIQNRRLVIKLDHGFPSESILLIHSGKRKFEANRGIQWSDSGVSTWTATILICGRGPPSFIVLDVIEVVEPCKCETRKVLHWGGEWNVPLKESKSSQINTAYKD